jgi:hypothetical protein
MNKITSSMFALLVFLLMGLGLESCEKQDLEELKLNDLELYDLELYELIVSPCYPDSDDQISVIEKICGTESEVILSFQGNQIGYKRYVNSLMMAPCSPRLDTTIIGQLNAGSYQLVQSIIDKNHLITDSIIRQDTIILLISK